MLARAGQRALLPQPPVPHLHRLLQGPGHQAQGRLPPTASRPTRFPRRCRCRLPGRPARAGPDCCALQTDRTAPAGPGASNRRNRPRIDGGPAAGRKPGRPVSRRCEKPATARRPAFKACLADWFRHCGPILPLLQHRRDSSESTSTSTSTSRTKCFSSVKHLVWM
jgi:hypothetical protein